MDLVVLNNGLELGICSIRSFLKFFSSRFHYLKNRIISCKFFIDDINLQLWWISLVVQTVGYLSCKHSTTLHEQ